MIQLTEEQSKAVDLIHSWYSSTSTRYTPFILAGLAGTGKTTIVPHIIKTLKLKMNQVAFCAFTGKASMVLRNKGLDASTIHKLIYVPVETPDGIIFLKAPCLSFDYKLIVVDEASMVSKEIQTDLESYGIPILYIGDHGQLPPVSNDMTNLMSTPHFKLETIHRQALDNPIIYVADLARRGHKIKIGSYGNKVAKISDKKITMDMLKSADQILCGKNVTRHKLNALIRSAYGFEGKFPVAGDKLICLKNNNKNGLINGMTGKCVSYKEEASKLTFVSDDAVYYSGLFVDEEIFISGKNSGYNKEIEQFDFGYCITTHKSQGSQYNKVIVFEEFLGDYSMHSKWLYTAITRAIDKLIIVGA